MNFKSVKNEDNAIILSAHCDDIPLSLGGCLIGKLFVRSPNVIVVFSITNYILGEEQAHSSEEITRIRIEEENKAAKLSNYHVRFLGFKDAICRPFYSNYSSLFHEDPVINDPIYPQVKRELKKILVNYGGIICSPLSIGNHVDHRILHHFTLELMNDNPNIPFLFYEDLPYASYIEKSKVNL